MSNFDEALGQTLSGWTKAGHYGDSAFNLSNCWTLTIKDLNQMHCHRNACFKPQQFS